VVRPRLCLANFGFYREPLTFSARAGRLAAPALDRAPPSSSRSSRCATSSPSTSGARPGPEPRSPIDCSGRGCPEVSPRSTPSWC